MILAQFLAEPRLGELLSFDTPHAIFSWSTWQWSPISVTLTVKLNNQHSHKTRLRSLSSLEKAIRRDWSTTRETPQTRVICINSFGSSGRWMFTKDWSEVADLIGGG